MVSDDSAGPVEVSTTAPNIAHGAGCRIVGGRRCAPARRMCQPVPKRSSSLAFSGYEDPLIWPGARRNVAEQAQSGRFVRLHKMSDSFSAPLWPQLVSEIDRRAL